MNITLISPRLSFQKSDFLGSGVPYWPVELATVASFLKQRHHQITVLDLFGDNPSQLEDKGSYYLQGASIQQFSKVIDASQTQLYIIYAISYMSHHEILGIASYLKLQDPQARVAVLENSQAVTAYALPHLACDFFSVGVDYLICGELYWNWQALEHFILFQQEQPSNILSKKDNPSHTFKRLYRSAPQYPFPAWELFNYKNYWRIPYAHGPKTGRYFPIYTSKGCPYPCDFCVVPEMNDRLWRARPVVELVDEIIYLRQKFSVKNFHIEDLNPTVKRQRFKEFCELLTERQVNIKFYIVSGTKAETIKVDDVPLLAEAGCQYISISPESGSATVMKAIGKPFNYEHGLALIKACKQHGINTQACFISGHPAETGSDHDASCHYLRQLVRNGLTEAAFFITAPFAGSELFKQQKLKVSQGEGNIVSFSPKVLHNWQEVSKRRQQLIHIFFAEKLKQGFEIWWQGLRAIFKKPQTKMENLPHRILFIYWIIFKNKCLSLRKNRHKQSG
jgi:anaerobic magnesium-protoporphyrin IX monomethyl ester cyclase